MTEEWLQIMTELREQKKAEQTARARIPQTCFFCDYMAGQPGFCENYQARPPARFMAREGACPDFVLEIPF